LKGPNTTAPRLQHAGINYEILKALLEAKADVNAIDEKGWMPLHCIVYHHFTFISVSCAYMPLMQALVWIISTKESSLY